MQTANTEPPAGSEDPVGRRACDQCRLRKIRCDKDWPCSNCRVAKRSCTSTGAGQRPKEPRARVLISSQYERKIDQIDARLAKIETILQSLVPSSSSPSFASKPLGPVDQSRRFHPSPAAATASSNNTTAPSVADCDSSDVESGYGGDSGLTSQTVFASEFLERAVKRTSLREANPKVEAALASLGQLVEMQKHRSISAGPRFPLQRAIPPGGLSKLPLPPLEFVVPLLKQTKEMPLTIFSITCALVGITDFTALCRLAYFPSDDFSDANFTVVNCGLYNLFMEQQILTKDPAERAQYDSYMHMCRVNLETGLANLPLFLSAKTETVMALQMGALYAIDVSRPSVAWHLTSTAAMLCQNGGFHRAESLRDDPPAVSQLKTILFWNVYALDKGLSLRLGRSSVVNDCDISIPRKVNFEGFGMLEKSSWPALWLEISILQSQIYEQLPAALAGPQSELTRRAHLLAKRCQEVEALSVDAREHELKKLSERNATGFIQIFIKGDEVQFHATKTLLYRVIPAPEGSASRFCDECLNSAREAMRTHQGCLHLLDESVYLRSVYVHWTLMLTPFAPFFVLFCYVVETSSAEDLRTIQAFVASLEKVRDASEAVGKLYRLCHLMCDVAILYVEAKSQQQEDHSMAPIGDEFEMYLSQLGLMPGEDQTAINTGDGSGPVQGYGPVAQIADWFSGNRNMIGLLEEDLSMIDPSSWMQQPEPM